MCAWLYWDNGTYTALVETTEIRLSTVITSNDFLLQRHLCFSAITTTNGMKIKIFEPYSFAQLKINRHIKHSLFSFCFWNLWKDERLHVECDNLHFLITVRQSSSSCSISFSNASLNSFKVVAWVENYLKQHIYKIIITLAHTDISESSALLMCMGESWVIRDYSPYG